MREVILGWIRDGVFTRRKPYNSVKPWLCSHAITAVIFSATSAISFVQNVIQKKNLEAYGISYLPRTKQLKYVA
jgi:hypothetical protein